MKLDPSVELSDEELYQKALERALKFLGPRARSRDELSCKLAQAGFDQTIVQKVEARLVELSLLDDMQFARERAEQQLRAGKSRALISRDLQAKGVGRFDIEDALSRVIKPNADGERALALAIKKAPRYSCLEPTVARRRLFSFLAQRGYSPDIASEACRKALAETGLNDE